MYNFKLPFNRGNRVRSIDISLADNGSSRITLNVPTGLSIPLSFGGRDLLRKFDHFTLDIPSPFPSSLISQRTWVNSLSS